MAVADTGRGTYIGAGEESTWGTAVSRTNWRPLISHDIKRSQTNVPREDLEIAASGSPLGLGSANVAEEAGGPAEFYLTYEQAPFWFKHAMGGMATTGAGPYVHTATLAALPTGLTLEVNRGSDANSEVMEGCKINQLTIDFQASSRATMALDVMAETGATRGAKGSETIAAGTYVFPHEASTLAWGGNTFTLKTMTIALNRSLERRDCFGTKFTAEPTQSNVATVTWACEIEYDEQIYLDHQAGTSGDAVITFTGTGNNVMACTLENAKLDEPVGDGVPGPGRIMTAFTLTGYPDATKTGLKIVTTNDNALATSN